MASSDEETIEPMGFTLKIHKFNRPMKQNRSGAKKSRTYSPYSSPKDSLSIGSIEDDIDVFDFDLDSPSSDATKKPSSDKPTPNRRRKKRSRSQILASISANAKRMPIPIPSFQMTKKRKESDVRSKKLSRLERAFFDEDDDDENDNDLASSSQINGDKTDLKVEINSKGSVEIDIDRFSMTNKITNKLSLSKEKSSGSCSQKESSNPSKSGDHGRDETESEGSDFEREFLSSSFANHTKQNQEENEKITKSKPLETVAEHEANPRSMNKHKVVETVKDVIQTFTEPGNGFQDNAVDLICNNNDTTYENEDGGDPNFVDFGGDGGGCVFDDDVTDGNCQELSSANGRDKTIKPTDLATSIKGPSSESTDICHNESSMPPSFDLDHEVDLLFQKSDTNTITMKMFCKELERRIGVSLEKLAKKDVKKRVMSLLKGETVPSSMIGNKIGTCGVQDRTGDGGHTKNNEKDSILKDNNTVTENEKENLKRDQNSKNDNDDDNEQNKNENLNSGTEAPSISETPCEVEVVGEMLYSSSSKLEEAEKKATIPSRNSIDQKKHDVLDREQNECKSISATENSNSFCAEIETEKSTNQEPGKQTKSKTDTTSKVNRRQKSKPKPSDKNKKSEQQKKSKNVSQHLTANQSSSLYCIEIESEKPANPKPDKQTKNKTDTTTKLKRQQKSKPKPSDKGNKSAKSITADPEKKLNRTRKRPRKAAACALCKTCPCQRTHTSTEDCDNIATLNVKNFSRSDDAVERTLLRRLQKLEKSTESLEEQTEIVRRRLKKHRRDVSKRRERQQGCTSNVDKTADSYFLPDAEVFEKQQNESQGFLSELVGKAQTKIFHNVPSEYSIVWGFLCVAFETRKFFWIFQKSFFFRSHQV